MPSRKEPREKKGGLVYSTETGDLRRKLEIPKLSAGESASAQGPVRILLDPKKHRGRTMTMIKGVPAARQESLLKELKSHCGVGGHIEEQVIFLQGDQRPRATACLKKLGISARVS